MDALPTWFLWITTASIIAALTGGIIGYLFARLRTVRNEAEISAANSRITELLQNSQTLESEHQTLLSQFQNASNELASARARIEAADESRTTIKNELEVLAASILEDKSRRFTEQNREQISQLLTPLTESLTNFKQQIHDSSKEDIKARTELLVEVRTLGELNKSVTQEAHNLTQALKGKAKTRGNWGELILETLLEKSGLVRGQNFHTQVSGTNDDGSRLQPDVIIDLPEGRHIIIDSKVSLNAYERWSSAEDDTTRKLAAKEHADALRTHIDQLSKKNYPAIKNLQSPEFVFMFIPIEPALLAALETNLNLVEYAIERRIALVTSSNLASTMRLIAQMWRQDKQNRFAHQIAELGGKLYDKFAAFCTDLESIGQRINQTQTSYDNAMKKLREGNGNLLRQTEKLRELGAKTTSNLS